MTKVIIVMITLVLFTNACLPTSQIQSITATPPETEAQMIKEWSGSGDKTTEPFTISSSPWVIEWEKNPESRVASMLLIMVYSPGSNIPVEIFESGSDIDYETDTNYIYHIGTFYLEIGAAACDWNIKIIGIP